ncbi:MAG: hypothetical protein ACUVQY_04835 [Thermoproteota archaeon]
MIREKMEKAIGPDAYSYYWEKEKELEELLSMLMRNRQMAEEAAKSRAPRMSLEEIRKRTFEETDKDKKERKGEAVKSIIKGEP